MWIFFFQAHEMVRSEILQQILNRVITRATTPVHHYIGMLELLCLPINNRKHNYCIVSFVNCTMYDLLWKINELKIFLWVKNELFPVHTLLNQIIILEL